MLADAWLSRVLILLGVGFLVANARIVADILRFRRLRPSAELIWARPKPPFYGLLVSLGAVFGALILWKLVVQGRPPVQVFGESMMLVYYSYALPTSLRIGRGFYADGIWSESGFVPYGRIGGLSWREGEEITLLMISRMRKLASRLVVPHQHYGAARRLLRDKIAAHDIEFTGERLALGAHDIRDDA